MSNYFKKYWNYKNILLSLINPILCVGVMFITYVMFNGVPKNYEEILGISVLILYMLEIHTDV